MLAEVQKYCSALGASGCYEFSIMYAGEMETGIELGDPVDMHVLLQSKGLVAANCTVLDAGAIMAEICGGRWICLKAGIGRDSAGRPYDLPLDYVLRPGEHDIHRFERKETTTPGTVSLVGHFFYAGPSPLFDPYGESLTRLKGELVSRRILRRL